MSCNLLEYFIFLRKWKILKLGYGWLMLYLKVICFCFVGSNGWFLNGRLFDLVFELEYLIVVMI